MSVVSRFFAVGALALSALVATPALACHSLLSVTSSTNEAGAVATYTVTVSPNYLCVEAFADPHAVLLTFPSGFDVSAASFDASSSSVSQAGGPYGAFPAVSGPISVNAAARQVTIAGIQYAATWQTRYQLVIQGIRNPTSAITNQLIGYVFQDGSHTSSPALASGYVSIVVSPGIHLGATPSEALTYASEINATDTSPVTLSNASGDLNLLIPLSYAFSEGEVRYARVECTGDMRFPPGTDATVAGGAGVGAVNGAGTSAVYFSITAPAGGLARTDMITVSGDRLIGSTEDVSCTYGLYDYPSQASSGGSNGRIASVSGPYIDFDRSYDLAVTPATATADVEATPAFTQFEVSGETTATTAALAEIDYGLGVPTPNEPSGAPITLADLMGANTTLVVTGDFSAAANADGSFTGAALNRVFLSTNNASCVVGTPSSTLTATEARFVVGATAVTDRNLCFTPNGTAAVAEGTYDATLDAVAADATAYTVTDLGPVAAGEILHNGTELQAPLVQLPAGWLSRLVLTNTGNVARPYAIAVTGETGRTFDTDNLAGTVPANGTKVIDLNSVMSNFNGNRRATLNVTVAGPNTQIQGLYQIVNPAKGSISNEALVRPGSN